MNLDVYLLIFYGLAGTFCVGFCAYRIAFFAFPDPELLAAQQRLGVESATRQYRSAILKWLAPFFLAIVPRIQQFKIPNYRKRSRELFVAAGVDDQFDPDEFLALKIIAGILFPAFITVFLVLSDFSPSLWMILASAGFGFFYPDIRVRSLRSQRQRTILRQLPSFMDLLTLSVEAGLDFMAAITRVVSFAKDGPLREEFSRMLKELQVGTVRADALRNMADRVQLTELSSFATILIQADQMGSSIGPVLRAQSDLLRSARFQRAEREGAKAAQKILIPLVLFILPAVFIVIMGPQICDIYYNQSWFKDIFGGP